jgi:hypothetical protein
MRYDPNLLIRIVLQGFVGGAAEMSENIAGKCPAIAILMMKIWHQF